MCVPNSTTYLASPTLPEHIVLPFRPPLVLQLIEFSLNIGSPFQKRALHILEDVLSEMSEFYPACREEKEGKEEG